MDLHATKDGSGNPAFGMHYSGLETQSEPNFASVLDYLFDVLRRKWLLVLAITLVMFALATIASYLITPRYEAVVKIKLDPRRNAAIGVSSSDSSGVSDQYTIDTEIKTILSREVAVQVVKDMKLSKHSEFAPSPADVERGKEEGLTAEDLAANKLRMAVSAAREGQAYIIGIRIRAKSAETASDIANHYATAYMNLGVGARSGTASRQADMLRKRLAEVGGQLAAMEGTAAQYKAEAGIMGGGPNGTYGSTVIDQQVGSLSGQLATALSSAAAAQSKLAVAQQQMQKGGMDAVSAVLNSPVIGDLRRQRAEVIRDLGEIQARYGSRHPEMIKVTQQLQQLDDQIDAEGRRVVGGLASEAAAESAKAASIQGQMSQLKGQQANSTRAGVTAQGMQLQADAKRDNYNQLAAELQRAESISRNNLTQAQVVEAASTPQGPSFPNRLLFMVFGLVSGLTIGAGVVTVQELTTKGIKSAEELESGFGIRVLSSIPDVPKRDLIVDGRDINPADVLLVRPLTAFSESFRIIKTVLSKVESRRGHAPFIALASCVPNEGKTTSSLALARVLAMGGEKILIIDGDIRKAGLSGLIEGNRQGGLIELLTGAVQARDVILHDQTPNLDVLPVARSTFEAVDYFSDERFMSMVNDLRPHYDRILIDTPPILAVSDARTIISKADAAIMLVRWGDTSKKTLRSALAWLEQDGIQLLGCILNRVDVASPAMNNMYNTKLYKGYYQDA